MAEYQFLKKIVSISNGQTEGAIIADDNSLWMWGENSYGQVGNGSNLSVQGTPVKVMDNVAAVSCGGYHAAAIKTDGTLWMWGANYLGQLGIGTLTDSDVPVKVMDNVLAVSCGGDHTAVIKTDGTLWMFGCNNTCQLGDGWGMDTTGKSGFQCRTSPVKVLDDVVAVSCGWKNTAAIKSDGSLWIWGTNGDGQLGNGGVGNDKYNGYIIQTTPTKIMENVDSVSIGWNHAAAIKTDGSLWTWGENRSGQLGNGGTGNELDGAPTNNPEETWFYQTTPVKVMDDVAAVNCAYTHTVAVKTDGSVWAWGENIYDQQGNKAWNVRKEFPKGRVGIYQTVPLKIMDHASIPTKPIPTVAGFSDVYANDYYADAVVWAKDTGVTGGKKRANGEGSIRKRKDGRWEGRYTAGHDLETGKAIYKNVLGRTQAEVKEKLKTAIKETQFLDQSKAGKYTVGEWMEVWYEDYAKLKVRPSSHQTYRGYIDNHINLNIGDIPLEKLTSLDLQKLYKKLLTKGRVDRLEAKGQPKGLSAKTVRNIHQILSSALKLALQNGVDTKTVSGMLGHSSAGFTLDTEVHVTSAAQRQAEQTMGNVLSCSL